MINKIKNIIIIDESGRESTIQAEFIGKGQFARCYRVGDSVYSFVNNGNRHSDYSKEAVSMWADSNNVHIPQIEKMGNYDNKHGYGILYKMPYYESLSVKHAEARSQFKKLKKAFDKNLWNVSNELGFEKNQRLIQYLRDNSPELESIIDALESIDGAGRNYGDNYIIEIGKRNIKVDSEGRLILLDVLFNADALKERRG
ncbi:MAG: hypothetical protein ACKVQK_31485 [Burkholderiales bacterium]